MSSRSNLLDLIRQTVIDVMVEELALRHRINQEYERRTGGACDPSSQKRHGASPNLGDMLQDVAKLGLHNMRELAHLHHRYADLVIDSLSGWAAPQHGRHPKPEPILRSMSGIVGGTVEVRFLLCNACNRAAEFSFRTSEIREHGTDKTFPNKLSFDPLVPKIPPGGEVVVVATMQLDDNFTADRRYTCHVDAIMNSEADRSFVLDISVYAVQAPRGV